VLLLARLDAGIDQPVRTAVGVDDVVAAAVAIVQPLAAARDVSIVVEPAPRVGLSSDAAKLTKILSNLIDNAVGHSPPGEAVCVAASAEDGTLEIAVSDRGPGIATDMRHRIFDRFVRADSARAGGDGHYGLGLPIAAGLARLLGGDVSLDERHRPGSRFVVRLPIR
jgi:two-component system sensor histidine kinase SenX3